MAWTVETFAGRKANGPTSDWRTAMYELCRAVNQRQVAAGFGQTTFYKANGTQGSFITSDDLLGLKTTKPTSYVETNLKRIQSAIKTMASGADNTFMQASGASDPWTVAELETAIGASFLTEPRSAVDAAYWQQLKDALDLLIYVRHQSTIGVETFAIQYNVPGGGPYIYTLQDAWDAAIANGGTEFSTGTQKYLDYRGAITRFTPLPYLYSAASWTSRDCTAPLDLQGELTEARYTYHVSETPSGALTGDMNLTINTTALVSPSSDGFVVAEPGDISLSGDNAFTFSCDMPATCPLATPLLSPGYCQYAVSLDKLIVFFDIASVLDDQA